VASNAHVRADVGTHDKVFRSMLQNRDVANALLRERLPPETVRQLSARPEVLSTTFLDRALKESITDVLLRVRLRGGRNAFVYCLIEHKRTGEADVMFQLLRYLGVIYERLRREFPMGRLPIVVPLVVYNGRRRWRGTRRFRELLRGPRDAVRFALDFGVVLVDLGRESPARLSRNDVLRGGLTALKVASAPDSQRRALIEQAIASLSSDPSTLRQFLHYLGGVVHESDRSFVDRTIRKQLAGEKTMITMADVWIAQGYRRGRNRGLKKGLEKGLEKGREEGREEGRAEGLRQSIDQVLRSRFKKVSPDVQKKLASAPASRLPTLLSRAATARRISEVFASH
jgi:predicted transposase/invertase (TIGR01784 family)